ncbi:NUDIX domain-containing protein [Enterovirga rhinocerotis]|uniref:Putative NUDIX family NTP pyrophosphohydrolase n=1 Tax=Enterovirga rhinocerotis TaxID=1339210 RepID=A0A4R7C8U4_9HYPH|nr:NUDIX domain-containing protein [Enterovirga rhinocerotis]TDR94811.1 putative NUDIX family NTP pyrophosphohydrolase [Enterovirga rhinocerotis]
MAKRSAGLLLWRSGPESVEVLLAHPGGPFWARRDDGAWTIPKGGIDPGEEPLAAARREFREETGHEPPLGTAIPLGEAVQPSRKIVTAFALEGDFDPGSLAGDSIIIEWPPRSGRRGAYPEIDRVGWFGLADGRRKLLRGQVVFLDRLAEALAQMRGIEPLSRGS